MIYGYLVHKQTFEGQQRNVYDEKCTEYMNARYLDIKSKYKWYEKSIVKRKAESFEVH